jgi:hypothetical protein
MEFGPREVVLDTTDHALLPPAYASFAHHSIDFQQAATGNQDARHFLFP